MENNFRFKKSELGVFIGTERVVNLLEKDCRIMGLTRGNFSLIDLIYGILKKVGKSDVVVCTWSAGIKDANQVKWMLNEDIINSFTIVTDHSYATRQKKYAASIEDIFGKENIRVSDVHAKFVLIKNEKWNICIRTSMNLNANKTCESFEIDDSKDIYDFYYKYIQHAFKNMPNGFTQNQWTVNKVVNEFFYKENNLNMEIEPKVSHDIDFFFKEE